MTRVNLDAVERTMQVLAERSPLPFTYHDPSNGQRLAITPQTLSSRAGYLPAIVTAGEAIWREVTGKGFELDIVRDSEALLGYRLRGIGAGSFTTLMLASMEAIHHVEGPEAILVSELNAVWAAATERRRHAPDAPTPGRRGLRP